MKTLIKKHGKWIILFICVIIFIEIVENIFQKEISKFDSFLYHTIALIMNPGVTILFKIITHCGDWVVILPTCAILMFTLKEKNQKIAISLNLVTIFLLNQFMKLLFNRPRPTENVLIEAVGYSFPSGHSMVSMAFYGLLIYLAYKNIKNKGLRNSICIGLTILILLIGISRIYLGVHFASDVIGGFCVSMVYLILMISILKEKLEKKERIC